MVYTIHTSKKMANGKLYLAATPIGNLEDISLRVAKTLLGADFIACEDTRRFGILYHQLGSLFPGLIQLPKEKPLLVSFYEGNENVKKDEIMALLHQGKNGCLVSNAGTPLVSDPGYQLVRQCISEEIMVIPLPGPSALTTALCASGMSADRVFFVGFLPRKGSKRTRLFESVNVLTSSLPHTLVIYESPFRLAKTLADIDRYWPEAEAVVARELTKVYEEFVRGTARQLLNHIDKQKVRGEIVLLIRVGQKASS